MQTATTQQCPHCHGKGETATWVQWSDGLGGSSRSCSVCGGKGDIDFSPVAELARVKELVEQLVVKTWHAVGYNVKPTRNLHGSEQTKQAVCNDVLLFIRDQMPEFAKLVDIKFS